MGKDKGRPPPAIGVKLVRGPFLVLPAHRDHTANSGEFVEMAREMGKRSGRLLAADLFSGAGGLSLGLQQAGIDVVMGVDHYKEAVETHAHHFPGISVDWDLSDVDVVERVADLMVRSGITVLCGGPPCQPFSKAGRSKIRHRVRGGERDPHDQRRDLWRSFLEIVRLARPTVVVMENVPDMALDREMFIFRSIIHELEAAGYSVESRIVDTSDYGVPQFRQRLIIVALADGVQFTWPVKLPRRVSLWNAIGDLPEVEGGWRPSRGADGWMPYRPTAVTSFQERMRDGVSAGDADKLFDHITRPVREDDREAFLMMDSSTKYSDLPAELKRYRDDIFDDKYKRLDEDDLSRTITAHIAKDGYWYIHPRQPRTLTVREAARIQTFPDWYRFAGGPTAAFKQIGNAVPPALGFHLGNAVLRSLKHRKPARLSSSAVAERLAAWFDASDSLSLPWLRSSARWQVVVAATLLSRSSASQVRDAWPIVARWLDPDDTLAELPVLKSLGGALGRSAQASRIRSLAEGLRRRSADWSADEEIVGVHGISRNVAELSVLAVPPEDEVAGEQPVIASQPSLRVAARFTGKPVDRQNRLSDGRVAIARMVGAGHASRRAQLAIIEISNALCKPAAPVCGLCPLAQSCAEAGRRSAAHGRKSMPL